MDIRREKKNTTKDPNSQEELYEQVVKHSPPSWKVPLERLMPLSPLRLSSQELDAALSLGQVDPREKARGFASLEKG